MPKGIEQEWPTDKEIVAGIVEYGSEAAYARAISASRASLVSHVDAAGLRERVQEARIAARPKARSAKPLGSQVSREEILEQENRELRAAIGGERKAEVRRERYITAIERALAQVTPPPSLAFDLPPLRKGDTAHHRALLLLSDAHGGEVVKPSAVNGLNEYNFEIMVERHAEILRGVASHIRRMPPLTGLDLGILGDNNSGANHRELEVTNQYPLAIQGIKMGYLLGDFVTQLAAMVRDLRVVSVPGNHPRLTEKPAAKDVDNNMDVVSTVLAEEITRGIPHVTWKQPDSNAIFHEIAGRLCYIFHGDGIQSSMPGVPWGGVMRRTNVIQAGHRRHIDHFCLGHFHQANVVDGGRIVMNGSVKGVDEWVLKRFGGGQPPTQLLLLFDETKSRLTDVKYLTPTAGLPEQ
jgi:hypothetical protein